MQVCTYVYSIVPCVYRWTIPRKACPVLCLFFTSTQTIYRLIQRALDRDLPTIHSLVPPSRHGNGVPLVPTLLLGSTFMFSMAIGTTALPPLLLINAPPPCGARWCLICTYLPCYAPYHTHNVLLPYILRFAPRSCAVNTVPSIPCRRLKISNGSST